MLESSELIDMMKNEIGMLQVNKRGDIFPNAFHLQESITQWFPA